MVRWRDATQRFPDGTVALRGVTLEVPRGQFCVVLGSSGAGKTTLLRAVNGLVPLTAGSVEVDGVPVGPATLGAVRAKVAMIHQSFGLVGRTTVLDNVLDGALREVSPMRALFGLFRESAALRSAASEPKRSEPAPRRPPAEWELRQPFGARTLAILLAASLLLGVSARHTEIPRIFTSDVGKGLRRFASGAWPLV